MGEFWLNVFVSLRAEASTGCSGRDAGSGQFDSRRLGITPFPLPEAPARKTARTCLSLAWLEAVCLRKTGQCHHMVITIIIHFFHNWDTLWHELGWEPHCFGTIQVTGISLPQTTTHRDAGGRGRPPKAFPKTTMQVHASSLLEGRHQESPCPASNLPTATQLLPGTHFWWQRSHHTSQLGSLYHQFPKPLKQLLPQGLPTGSWEGKIMSRWAANFTLRRCKSPAF